MLDLEELENRTICIVGEAYAEYKRRVPAIHLDTHYKFKQPMNSGPR